MNATGALRRVLLRPPRADELSSCRTLGWRGQPDAVAIAEEHQALCDLLAGAGAEVSLATASCPGDADAIYVYDPVLMTDGGAVLLRLGKEQRVDEALTLEPALQQAGVTIAARMDAPATADGGDMFWLDDDTLLVGRGYRTNDAGVAAIRAAVPGAQVHVFDLPHLHGHAEVLHLMSLISPLAEDLVVAYLPLLPVRLVELLDARGIEIGEVPDDEFESMGANVLALAPRVALALARNVETRRRLESAGVTVLTYEGTELSKGDGGPTCLTRPLVRD